MTAQVLHGSVGMPQVQTKLDGEKFGGGQIFPGIEEGDHRVGFDS